MSTPNAPGARKRIPYLDLLKFFAIASVLLGHATEQLSGDDFWDHPVWSFIYTYHMPLFMLLCGYFAGSSMKMGFGAMLHKKSIQLLVPTLSMFGLMYLLVVLLGRNPSPLFLDFSWTGFANTVWFLKCVLMCYVVAWVFMAICRGNAIAAGVISSILFTLLPWADVANFNFMLPMFWIGYWLNLKREMVERNASQMFWLSLGAFAVMLPFWSGHLTIYETPIRIFDFGAQQVDLYNLGVTLYRLAIGVAGSLNFFFLAPRVYNLLEGTHAMEVMNNIGRSTLGIYIAQTLLLEIVMNIAGIHLTLGQSLIAAPLLACAEMAACYGAVNLLRRNRLTRLLFLGENALLAPHAATSREYFSGESEKA